MGRYAAIEGQQVVNVVVAEHDIAESLGLVECGDAAPGWTYVDGVFLPPVPPEE